MSADMRVAIRTKKSSKFVRATLLVVLLVSTFFVFHFLYFALIYQNRDHVSIDGLSYNKYSTREDGGRYICFFVGSKLKKNIYHCGQNFDQKMIFYKSIGMTFSVEYYASMDKERKVQRITYHLTTPNISP